jgi:hypothetical protein
MKVTAVSLALVGSVIAAGGADTVNQVLTQIATDLKDFDAAIKAYGGGDASALTAASKKIEQTTTTGAGQIAAGAELSLTDAVGITSNVQSLQTTLDGALSDLKAIGDKLAAAGQCSTILDQLASQGKSAQGLQDAITSKAPAETKAVAQQLGGAIGASIAETNTFFTSKCAGAPSGGSSGGMGDHAGMGGHGGSSSSGGSPSSGGSAAGSKTNKASKTSAVPKPATYAGAGSSLSVPFFGAVALAFFAL